MSSLPLDIILEIVKNVGRTSFRNLGPFIAGGHVLKNIAFSAEVLSEVGLDEFIYFPQLGHPDSSFRPFLNRCLDVGHLTARYVVGLRILTTTGPSQEAINHLLYAAADLMYAHFACAAFLCLCNNKESGNYCFESFLGKVEDIDEAKHIAEQVCQQIQVMGNPGKQLYRRMVTWGTLDDVPFCQFEHEDDDGVCHHCFALSFCWRIQEMC